MVLLFDINMTKYVYDDDGYKIMTIQIILRIIQKYHIRIIKRINNRYDKQLWQQITEYFIPIILFNNIIY